MVHEEFNVLSIRASEELCAGQPFVPRERGFFQDKTHTIVNHQQQCNAFGTVADSSADEKHFVFSCLVVLHLQRKVKFYKTTKFPGFRDSVPGSTEQSTGNGLFMPDAHLFSIWTSEIEQFAKRQIHFTGPNDTLSKQKAICLCRGI